MKNKKHRYESFTQLKKWTKKAVAKSTYEEFMEAKTPHQRKKFNEGYKEFLLSEMILAAMEEDDVSVRQLAKLAGVSPTIVQEMRSGTKKSLTHEVFLKYYRVLDTTFYLKKMDKLLKLILQICTKNKLLICFALLSAISISFDGIFYVFFTKP